MKRMNKFLALGLAAAMALSVAACGNKDSNSGSNNGGNGGSNNGGNGGSNNGGAADNTDLAGTGDGHINIGSWWVQYYDSDDKMEDNPDWQTAQPVEGDTEEKAAERLINLDVAERKFANVDKIEEKYGVTFTWDNLTYEGVKTSINTSILAGNPDCEIYLVEAEMAVPAQANGLAIDLKTILPEDDDLFTDQMNMGYLDLGDGKACILYQKTAQDNVSGTYPLGFNMQLLEENNLEDPRELYKRGEWTWEKFIEYCQVLTQDTDGDGQIDQYGYCGYQIETMEQLMMSNGASIATGTTETLSSAATGEALQMMYDMYNTYNIAYPYDFDEYGGTPSDSMRIQYREGNIGFFPIAVWIANAGGDYGTEDKLGFDTAYVRWPVGPSGNQETNPGKNAVTSAAYFIISAGSKNPVTAYHVLYDFFNWYEGDLSLRDNRSVMNWWYDENARIEELKNENFACMFDAGSITETDFWLSLGVDYGTDAGNGLQLIIKGEMTPAQFQETFKQQVQDGLDAYFK